MTGTGVICIVLMKILACLAGPIIKPSLNEEQTRAGLVGLRKPIIEIEELVVNLKQSRYDHQGMVTRNLDYDKIGQKCGQDFGSKENLNGFYLTSGMKHFQDLVRLTQDIQISESWQQQGDETPFVQDMRHVEYSIRELVEDKMRNLVLNLMIKSSEIPAYSVGGLYDAKRTDAKETDAVNVAKLIQIVKCLNSFHKKVIPS